MTVLKSKINPKDIKFIKNQKQLSVDYKLTHEAVEIAAKKSMKIDLLSLVIFQNILKN